MSLIKCPDCGKLFSEYAECCPECGCPTEDAKAELVNTEKQAPFANPLFPPKQEEINHVVTEDKAEPFVQDKCDRKLQQPENTIQDNSDIDIPENKGKLTEKPKMSETSKDEKYFSIAVIVCVLMVGLIILGFIGRCSTERVVHKGEVVKDVVEDSYKMTDTDLICDTAYFELIEDKSQETNTQISSSMTFSDVIYSGGQKDLYKVILTPPNYVHIVRDIQDVFEYNGTFELNGEKIIMTVDCEYDNNDNYYVTGTLKNNKLIIEESDNINLKGWELPRID